MLLFLGIGSTRTAAASLSPPLSDWPTLVLDPLPPHTPSTVEETVLQLTFHRRGVPLAASVAWRVEPTELGGLDPAAFAGGVYPSGLVTFGIGDSGPRTVALRFAAQVRSDRATALIRLEDSVNAEISPDSETRLLTVMENAAPTAWIGAGSAVPASVGPGQTVTWTLTPSGSTVLPRGLTWEVRPRGPAPALAGDFAAGVFPGGTLVWAAGEGDARTVVVTVAGSLEAGALRGAELVVTSVVDFVLPAATAPFAIVPPAGSAWSLASYAAQWQLFNPAAGAVTQLADGVRLLAPPGPDSIWLASRAQFDPAAGFEIDFDYRVLDSHGDPNGTFISVALVRGDGTAGHPPEIDQWSGDVPTEASLQAHAAGLRALFANRNDADPSIENEFRIRLYPSYIQFAPSHPSYAGDGKIAFAVDVPYHVRLELLGTRLSLTATSSAGIQSASYSDGSLALAGPHTLLLRHHGRRDAEIGGFSIAVPDAPPPDPGAAWTLPAEESLPTATTTVTAADDAELTSRIAAATAGTRILLTGSSYGPRTIARQIGDHDSGRRAVIEAATHLAPKIAGSWSIAASGWILKGLDFVAGGGTRVAVEKLGVSKGYFRLTRCRIALTDATGTGNFFALHSEWGNGWWGGGIDYCTIIGAQKSRCVFIRTREERDLLIHHNHVHSFHGAVLDGKKHTSHGFFLGTEDESTGWRVARVFACNLIQGAAPGYSFALEVKGSRTLVINNEVSGPATAFQHRNGYHCDFVGNTAGGSRGALAYGHGDLWVDNRITGDALHVKMGNYDQVDWLGLGTPPQSGKAPDRYTTFYDRYAHEFANDLTREKMPSPRPACSQSLFIGNSAPKGTIVGQADTVDVQDASSTVRSRARPARNCLIQNHTGPITLQGATYTIPGVAAAYQGPWPAQEGTVDKRALARPTTYPAGYRNAGAAFPPAYVPIPLSTANCGATAG